MNDQREKLIDILSRFHECLYDETMDCNECDYKDVGECCDTRLADYLIAHGVVVLPCKVGDTVYDIYETFHNGEGDARALKVTDIHIHLDKRNKAWIIIGGYYFALDDFGKTVFLTREEAERALAKRKGGGE